MPIVISAASRYSKYRKVDGNLMVVKDLCAICLILKAQIRNDAGFEPVRFVCLKC